jgi:hypothetical protein
MIYFNGAIFHLPGILPELPNNDERIANTIVHVLEECTEKV